MSAAADQATAQAPQAAATINDEIAAAPDATPEQKDAGHQYVQDVMDAVHFDPAQELAGAPESIQTALAGSTNRVDAMGKLADFIQAEPENSSDAIAASVGLTNMRAQLDNVVFSNPDVLQNLPKDSPAIPLLQQYGNVIANTTNTPKISKAIGLAKIILQKQAEAAEQQVGQ